MLKRELLTYEYVLKFIQDRFALALGSLQRKNDDLKQRNQKCSPLHFILDLFYPGKKILDFWEKSITFKSIRF